MKNKISLKRKSPRGFTLAEIVLALAILGILMSVVVPRFSGRTTEAKVQSARLQVGNLSMALDAFEFDTGRFPSTSEGLRALRSPSGQKEGWAGPYLKKPIPPDPWNQPYQYLNPGRRGSDFDLYSLGPDRREGGGDDIGNW